MFDASWRWEDNGVVLLDRNDFGASPPVPRTAHARPADGAALERALTPARPYLRALRAAAGSPIIVKASWNPPRSHPGQIRPERLQLSVGPKVLPWQNPRRSGIYNLVAPTDLHPI